MLATLIHVDYCIGFALYVISICTSSPLIEYKFLEDRLLFLKVGL